MKKPLFLVIGLSLVCILIISSFVMAHEGFGSNKNNHNVGRFGNFSNFSGRMGFRMVNSTIEQAIENKDYSAFVAAVGNSTYYSWNISEEKFDELVSMFKQNEQRQLENNKTRAEVETALQNKDYTAWVNAITSNGTYPMPRFAMNITQANFGTYADLISAMQDKNWTLVKELSEQLGVGKNSGSNFNMNFFLGLKMPSFRFDMSNMNKFRGFFLNNMNFHNSHFKPSQHSCGNSNKQVNYNSSID